MTLPVSAFIGFRYARAHKGNSFVAFINMFSVIGLALGLTALITVASVMNGFEGQLKQRILGVMPHIVVDTRSVPDWQPGDAVPNVVATTPYIEFEGVLQSAKGLQGVLIQGVVPADMKRYSIIARNMLIGDLAALQPKSYGVIIGRTLSVQLNIRMGEPVRLLSAGASVYTPFGRLPSQRVFHVVGIFDAGSEVDGNVVMVHQRDAANLQRKKAASLTETRLFLDDAFAYQEVEQSLSLPSRNWRVRQGPLFDAVKMEKNMMALMLILIIAVAAFNIVSALVMVVSEKHGDIAILRTQGMRKGQIMQIFLYNGVYNGLKGCLFGLVGGLIITSQLNNVIELLGLPLAFTPDGNGLPVDVQIPQVATMLLLSLTLSFLATLYPAYRALGVRPAQALKYE